MITEGYLARHTQGRSGMRGPALLDVAQDYALMYLHQEGIFDLGVALKGGTALRKFRVGNAGRFSTDLDFATPDADAGELLLDTLDGAELHGVRFTLVERETLRAKVYIQTPIGSPQVPARIEVSPRALWLPLEAGTLVPLPVHRMYEFMLPPIPTPKLEEALAEKLAAWRRRRKVRDLYDLHLFGRGVLNEDLIRRLLVLKVWHDVVQDDLGNKPFDPAEIVDDLDHRKLPPEDIGLLAGEVDIPGWLAAVRSRYEFLCDLGSVERRIARCNAGDEYEVRRVVEALRSSSAL